MHNITCVNGLIHPSIPVKGVVVLDTGILEGPTSGPSILWPIIPRDGLDAVASEGRSVEIMPFLFCRTAPENESCEIYF